MPPQEHFIGQARVVSVTRETILMKALEFNIPEDSVPIFQSQ
jgi:hypothetical protein